MKFAFLCDSHLPSDITSPQYAYLKMALSKMEKDGVENAVFLGDIVSYGEIESLKNYF